MNAKTQPNKGQVLARGKTKTLYETDDPGLLIMEFRDDTTAFDGGKKEQLEDKGAVNNAFNAHIMALLAGQGVEVHWLEQLDACSSLVRRLDMIPLEAVVRNTATGSLCRRLGVEEGLALEPPVFEFFYKDDERGDPMVNESHAVTFGWATNSRRTAPASGTAVRARRWTKTASGRAWARWWNPTGRSPRCWQSRISRPDRAGAT